MNRRVVAVAVGGVIIAAASLGTAFALPSHSSAKSGAFKFIAEQTASRNFHGYFIGGDKDVSGGHVIGTDTLQCVVQNGGKSASCDVAASFKRGQIYGQFTQDLTDGSLSGKVTGGTRTFKGAVGTIRGHSVSDTEESVTVTYQTP
jgi:hypothetical protein